MTLGQALKRISEEYQTALNEPFGGHELADFIRRDIPNHIKDLIGPSKNAYIVKGSPGQGQWSHSPWAAILDPVVTTTPERGYYPVFLFGPDFKTFSLILGQGTYAVRREFGKKGSEVLSTRGEMLRLRVPEFLEFFKKGPFPVISSNHAGGDWSTASVWGKTYSFDVSDNEIQTDITRMLKLYHIATSRGGYELNEEQEDETSTDDDVSDDTSKKANSANAKSQLDGERRLKYHKKIERQRNGKLAKDAKRVHGHVCQGCGFDFFKIYGEKGNKYIDAHHLVPLSSLASDGPVLLSPRDDFAVLCANCHRMIHRMGCPTLTEFRNSINSRFVSLLASITKT